MPEVSGGHGLVQQRHELMQQREAVQRERLVQRLQARQQLLDHAQAVLPRRPLHEAQRLDVVDVGAAASRVDML